MAGYWLSPKVEVRPVAGAGEGLCAIAPIARGERIVAWDGVVMTRAGLERLEPRRRANSVQIGDDAYLVPDRPRPGDHVNHCCEPNAGLVGDRTLAAMRAIAPGEQIGYDYATSDSTDYDEFDCVCGAPSCRGRVTGADWRRPELQRRYRGWFSPYLARRLDAGARAA